MPTSHFVAALLLCASVPSVLLCSGEFTQRGDWKTHAYVGCAAQITNQAAELSKTTEITETQGFADTLSPCIDSVRFFRV